MEKVEAKVL
jgi:hypothetical protein